MEPANGILYPSIGIPTQQKAVLTMHFHALQLEFTSTAMTIKRGCTFYCLFKR